MAACKTGLLVMKFFIFITSQFCSMVRFLCLDRSFLPVPPHFSAEVHGTVPKFSVLRNTNLNGGIFLFREDLNAIFGVRGKLAFNVFSVLICINCNQLLKRLIDLQIQLNVIQAANNKY